LRKVSVGMIFSREFQRSIFPYEYLYGIFLLEKYILKQQMDIKI